jgi:hypothetical protein
MRWVWLAMIVVLAGCAPAKPTPAPDLRARAALEATAIVQRAAATAVVLRAQSAATTLIREAVATATVAVPTSATGAVAVSTVLPASTRTLTPVLPSATPSAGATSALHPSGEVTVTTAATPAPAADSVELVGVGFAVDGGMIIVQFRAPPRIARDWFQGSCWVVDEGTGAIYNDIPVMPIIGPLIARPKENGQLGYVMLMNAPQPLQPGSRVTVVLGDFKQEHIVVE